MRITKPSYFDTFRCIAGSCPDSCCKEWSVQVDPEAAAYYRSLPGALGDRLRQVLVEEDGGTVMTIENRRCPMWRNDGLCRIQAELGEQALCHVCREFPRLRHDYGDFVELTLELSCPEAARIILSSPMEWVTESLPGGEEPEYDAEIMELLRQSRPTALALLENTAVPLPHRLKQLLMYGYHVQAAIDGAELLPFDPDAALAEADRFAAEGDAEALAEFYRSLDVLTDRWRVKLDAARSPLWDEKLAKCAQYAVARHWYQAVSDWDLTGRVKLLLSGCALLARLEGDPAENAQLWSKEIENSGENLGAVLDGAYTEPALTDANLLGLLR